MSRISRTVLTIPFLAACMAEPDPAPSVLEEELADPRPEITRIDDLGNVHGERFFRIVGSFPQAPGGCTGSATRYPDVGCYRVSVYCNGLALEPGRISFKAINRIDVSIRERPSGHVPGTGSRCAFAVQGLGQVAWSDYALAPPPIEIHGVADRGSVGSQHHFELYGYFPAGYHYSSSVACDGNRMAGGISTPNNPSTVPNQINIHFTESSTSSTSCVFTIYRLSDNVGAPPWSQRVNGPRTGSNALPSYWGAYYWGGFEPDWANRTNAPQIGVRRLHDAGITGPIRFTLSPAQRTGVLTSFFDWYDDYGESSFHIESGPGERCAGLEGVPDTFLPTASCTTRFLNALAEIPAGSTVVLTTLDEASAGGYAGEFNYLSLPWMVKLSNQEAVQREYRNLAAALFRTQAGTGKTFILSNWEADSMIYGGDCKGPAAFTNAVRDCDAPAGSPECIPVACAGYTDRIRALRLWFQLRKAGIDQARAEAGNPGGLTVLDAIEFAQYRIVHGQGMIQNCPVGSDGLGAEGCLKNADALHGIIPDVHPAVALYSAWESTGLGRVDQDLREIALYLYSTNPASPPRFGLGEFGQPGQSSDPFSEWLFRHHVSAARRSMELTSAPGGGAPLQFAIIWQAFPTVDAEEGLLTVEGAETDAMRMLYAGANDYGWGPLGSRIAGVRELPDFSSPTCHPGSMTRTEPYRYFELYGTFPGGASSKVWSKCASGTPNNHWSEATKIGSPSTGQINIRIPDTTDHPDIWCIFLVEGAGQTTPQFGPVSSPHGGPCNPVVP